MLIKIVTFFAESIKKRIVPNTKFLTLSGFALVILLAGAEAQKQ